MNAARAKVLVIGYGNPGRLDDGLGPALAEALEAMDLPGVTVESNYQLTVEDAAAVAEHDVVIFADAAVAGAEPFEFRPVEAGGSEGFSTHSVQPETVLALAGRLFDARTGGYTLAIRGYEFNEFGLRLSERAKRNLDAAVAFIRSALQEGNWTRSAPSGDLEEQP